MHRFSIGASTIRHAKAAAAERAGFIDFSKATSSRRPYLGRNGAPDKQSQIARWNQPFPALVGAAVKATTLSKCQWCHCWVWQPFDLLTFRHSTAVAVLPNNGCLRIEVDLLFRVSVFFCTLTRNWPNYNFKFNSGASAKRASKMATAWTLFAAVTRCVSAIFGCQLSAVRQKRWTQRNLFRVISFVEKKTANFNVSTRISRFPAIFRLVTTSKSAFVSPNFTLSTCDVLGIRHRLNSSSCTRANLVGDLRQCRGTFLTDGHAVRMCLWELDSVRMWNSRAIVISAEIGLLLSISEAETAIIRHGSNYGRRHFEFLH